LTAGDDDGDIAEDVIEIIRTLIEAIGKLVHTIDDEDHNKEIAFTQQFVARARQNHPGKNVLIVHPNHSANFVNSTTGHTELPLGPGGHPTSFSHDPPPPRSQGYTWYVFDSGSFKLEGDGGYENYCYAGNYQKNSDGSITFFQANQGKFRFPLSEIRKSNNTSTIVAV
jgi:hypothetical protein